MRRGAPRNPVGDTVRLFVPFATVGPAYPGATLAALIGLLVISYGFLKLGPAGEMREAAFIPEGRFRKYTKESLTECLRLCIARLGDSGIYRKQLTWDFLYMAGYGVAFAFLLDGTWGRVLRDGHDLGFRWLVFVPAALMVLGDFVENVLLLGVLPKQGTTLRRASMVGAASVFTKLKWVSLAIVLAAIASGGLTLAFLGPASL